MIIIGTIGMAACGVSALVSGGYVAMVFYRIFTNSF